MLLANAREEAVSTMKKYDRLILTARVFFSLAILFILAFSFTLFSINYIKGIKQHDIFDQRINTFN